MNSRFSLSLIVLALFAIGVSAQARRDAHIIYKDGFVIKGRVNESVREVIYDSASGRPFVIPSGNFTIDDHVRKILFSAGNVQKVVQLKQGEVKPPMRVVRFEKVFQPYEILEKFEFKGFGDWNAKGERSIDDYNPVRKGKIEMTQRVGIITPQYIAAATVDYKWNLMYFTEEFGPELSRKILLQIFKEKKNHAEYKDLSDADKLFKVAAFMQEAGWYKDAERELNGIIEAFPAERKLADGLLAKLKQEQAKIFVENLKKAAVVGQHAVAHDRLDGFNAPDIQKHITPAHRLDALDLKTKYEKSTTDIAQAKAQLKQLAAIMKAVPDWGRAAVFITEELNHDTIGRLETFLTFAKQFDDDRKAQRKPGNSAEEVLAIGVSGWLQGNQSAEPDVKNALKLLRAREMVLEFLKSDNMQKRGNILGTLKADALSADVIARLVRMLPPSHAHDATKLDAQVQSLQIEVPDSDGGSYLLQLPPDYHPHRAYPVLLLLHSGRDKPDETLKRFSDEAARNGFILAAPLWAGNKALKATYQYSASERSVAMDTLRDLRRRFQVDSDRVFLFGWEDGAHMAFDLGLSYPDQFAGVATMNGALQPFTRRFYWPNAQYLPFYVIEGERNGNASKAMRDLFKEWTRDPFASLYVEYVGRASEWYGAEVPRMLDWMSRKKRHAPIKEMGRANLGGGLGEEFRSTRDSDTSFYWLKAESILPRCQADHRIRTWGQNYLPATFQAHLSVGNEKDAKGNAKIWNQANIRVTGAKQISFWITPGMFSDLSKPLSIRVNGEQRGGMRQIQPSVETLLEEVYRTGDRQRVFIARIDL